jgi:DNA-binding transcriptional MerR regulator
MAERAYLSIGEVIELLNEEFPDLTISKIRFLEDQGLLDPERTASGYRKFYSADVERLRWILRQQRDHYLPLKVIKGRLVGTAPRAEEVEGGSDTSDGNGGDDDADAAALTAAPRLPDLGPNPLTIVHTGVSMTAAELAATSGLAVEAIRDLERFGLLAGRNLGGTVYYDEEALVVANLAAAFQRFGVEARHLRTYKTAAEREASLFEQLVMPMLKQRNPRSKRQAIETLTELSKLGQGIRAAMLRAALRNYTGP